MQRVVSGIFSLRVPLLLFVSSIDSDEHTQLKQALVARKRWAAAVLRRQIDAPDWRRTRQRGRAPLSANGT